MKYRHLFLVMIALFCVNMTSYAQTNENQTNMDKIRFIPEEFNNIKLGYYKTVQNVCSPLYPNDITDENAIYVNVPKKIMLNFGAETIYAYPVPICVAYALTDRRAYKYHHLSTPIVWVKNLENEGELSYEVVKKFDSTVFSSVTYDTPSEDEQRRNQEEINRKVKKAQRYRDDQLDKGSGAWGYMNIDLTEYLNVPLMPGKYEIWLSFSGLESNHCIVEIVAE